MEQEKDDGSQDKQEKQDLEENAAAVDIKLSEYDLDTIDDIVSRHPDVGERYSEGALKLVNR